MTSHVILACIFLLLLSFMLKLCTKFKFVTIFWCILNVFKWFFNFDKYGFQGVWPTVHWINSWFCWWRKWNWRKWCHLQSWSIRCWCQFSAKQQTLTFYEEELGKWPWVKTDWKKLQHDVWQHFGHAFNILSTGRKVFYSQQATERKNFELQILYI